MIEIISSAKINRKKWQDLLLNSEHATIYENLWYLDGMCSYEMVIRSDYSGGMILPIRKNKGFTTYSQPPFVQQCRWIGSEPSTDELKQLSALLQDRVAHIHINTNLQIPGFQQKKRVNLILSLKEEADSLYKEFRKDVRKNIKKNLSSITVLKIDEADVAIDLYRKAYGALNKQIKQAHYQSLAELLKIAIQKNNAEILLCVDTQDHSNVLASMVFLKAHKRLHYILGAPTLEGRNRNALSVGIWSLIQDYAVRDMHLDFEGSSISNVANFYRGFGAEQEHFYELIDTPSWVYKVARLLRQ
ncbi:MAG: hypothetical protein JXR19_05100 [Bacteroidia bacterium]